MEHQESTATAVQPQVGDRVVCPYCREAAFKSQSKLAEHIETCGDRAQPQADGADRPFNTNGATEPVLVHTEKSGPAFQIERRNAAITSLVEPMARLLYSAMQIQALGTIDFVLFEDLPVRTKDQLIADARTALHLQSSLYRELSERKAKQTFADAIKDAAFHYPVLNPCADHREQDRRAEAMKHVAKFMELLDIPSLMLGAYKRVLTEPFPSSATAQVARTAIRGMF